MKLHSRDHLGPGWVVLPSSSRPARRAGSTPRGWRGGRAARGKPSRSRCPERDRPLPPCLDGWIRPHGRRVDLVGGGVRRQWSGAGWM